VGFDTSDGHIVLLLYLLLLIPSSKRYNVEKTNHVNEMTLRKASVPVAFDSPQQAVVFGQLANCEART
jgi:hypothetical protein